MNTVTFRYLQPVIWLLLAGMLGLNACTTNTTPSVPTLIPVAVLPSITATATAVPTKKGTNSQDQEPCSTGKINCLRKHLSQVKGGQLAKYAAPAHIVSLILSDLAALLAS